MSTSSDALLRQLSSSQQGWMESASSRRWEWDSSSSSSHKQMEHHHHHHHHPPAEVVAVMRKKRVMVVVDQSSHSKHAMMWALTHVTNTGDVLTLLHIVAPQANQGLHPSSLASLCKASKPEVEVEALVIEGPKMQTVMNQVKKLEVSVLVLGQNKPSPFKNWFCMKSSTEEFVDECINTLECLTIGVKKQSNGVGGYLISTRWHKNFWLLA